MQVDSPWQMQVVTDILELSSGLLRKPLVPQANLCISMRLLEELEEAGLPATYQPEFGLGRRTSRDVAALQLIVKRSAAARRFQTQTRTHLHLPGKATISGDSSLFLHLSAQSRPTMTSSFP